MRKAFTLIELLAVIGIVGMLGVAAAASYGALVTGMRDRSACAAATAVLREACERARIDRLPTVVYCYNVCLKESKADDPGRVVGLMTAIRRVGRITQVKGRYLFDEFADLDQSYKKTDSEAELREMDGFRLFKYNDESSVQSRMQYSVVANAVYCKDYGSKPGEEGELTIF
ncbi:MAG: type II secretion system protein, partial [Kiritimatiellae bacterium]|nr:type II secretion system protein [Kiritimatiellia bacterium]